MDQLEKNRLVQNVSNNVFFEGGIGTVWTQLTLIHGVTQVSSRTEFMNLTHLATFLLIYSIRGVQSVSKQTVSKSILKSPLRFS